MKKNSKSLCTIALCVAVGIFGSVPAQANPENDALVVGLDLARILQEGRTIIAGLQPLINDPTGGTKGIKAKEIAISAVQNASDGLERDLDYELVLLLQTSIFEVVDQNLPTLEKEGIGFKGFVPATFARLVVERFNEKAEGAAKIKITAPYQLVRNLRSLPDEFENRVIQEVFGTSDWIESEAYFQSTTEQGQTVSRVLLPEYYSNDCLGCHGGPSGELDITGHPKEGGELGQLGGVISVTISGSES